MKTMFLSLLLAAMTIAGTGCSDSDAHKGAEKPLPVNELEATAKAMEALIEQYGQYPYEEVGALLRGAWRVDCSLLYSVDYAEPLEVDLPMGTTLLPDKEECFLAFYPEGNIYLYAYNTDYSLKQRTDGTWRFNGRTEELTLAFPEESYGVRLRAVGGESLILEWTNGERAMRTLFKFHPVKELIDSFEVERITLRVNSAISGGADYDREQAAKVLIGEWRPNTDLEYDQNWERIISCPIVDNYMFIDGGIYPYLTISADGTYLRHYEVEDPSFGDGGYIENRGDWQFDPMTEELIFTGEYVNTFKIRALTERYFVADYYDKINKDNHRAIYERR